MCAEELALLVRDNPVMRHSGRFILALVLAVVLAVAAVVGTIALRDRDGLPVGELLRVEPVSADSSSLLGDHLKFVSVILGGTRRFTEADLAGRFTPNFGDGLTVDDLNLATDALFADGGTIRFVRVRERQTEGVRVLSVAEDGIPLHVVLVVDEDGRIDGLTIEGDPGHPLRLPAWESTLILLAGWVLIAAAAAAWRYRAAAEAWTLLAASIPALAGVVVLSNSSAAYTAGRAIPSLVLVFAVALLIGPKADRRKLWVLAGAVAAAFIGALAPLVRDSLLIGHPTVVGAFTNDETVYRVLLTSSAGFTFLAMGGVAAVNIGRIGRVGRKMRPALWFASSIAAVWAIAALGTAFDYSTGDGTLANGPFKAVTWSALAVVPALVILRLVISSWDRPELATLVIDLESEDADLQRAIARALEDPTLQVLTSPDGELLLNEAGEEVSTDQIPDDRALTRIQSGPRLVGGLIHTSALQRDPVRLKAVAAAAGMALEVSRLNLRVIAQLDEVGASRARILQASDTSRRRVERDLHDGAQQRLVALGLRLQRARRMASSEERDELVALLEDATREVRDTIEEIRAVSRGGQPALLAERGLTTAVDALAERAPVPVIIDITAKQLPASVERTAYYVIAEGLTNVAKHAMATNAQVSITQRNGVVCVTIRDDGKGGAEITAGSGLEGLNDRVAATGGAFNISSGPGGTTLEATIPCA